MKTLMALERLDPQEGLSKLALDHLARYRFASQLVNGKRVLDIACGVGYGSAILADAGAEHVVGVDRADIAIERAKSMYSRPSIRYQVGDVYALEPAWTGSFDIVVCFETLEHLSDPARALDAFAGALALSGILVISVPNDLSTGAVNEFHLQHFTHDRFAHLLRKHFSSVRFFTQHISMASVVVDSSGLTLGADLSLLPEATDTLANSPYFIALCSRELLPSTVATGVASTKVWRDLDDYINRLESARDWLDGQRLRWEDEARRVKDEFETQQRWVEELQRAKNWLEDQWEYWKNEAERRAASSSNPAQDSSPPSLEN